MLLFYSFYSHFVVVSLLQKVVSVLETRIYFNKSMIKIPGIEVVMVNFTCQFDCGRDAQIAGKILLLSMSVRLFQERLTFEFVD